MNEIPMQEMPDTTIGENNGELQDTTDAEDAAQNDLPKESPPITDPNEELELLADSREDSDPHLQEDDRLVQTALLEELRRELNTLRDEMQTKEAARARLEGEFAEFCALYPGVDIHTVSDSVWSRVKDGIPLSCAYAVEERRHNLIAEAAKKSNAENSARSGGSIKPAPRTYFSRAEVMAMNRREVHENFNHILKSMEKWS